MKSLITFLAAVSISVQAFAGFTLEWSRDIKATKDSDPVATIDNQSITVRPVAPAKPKDPPRLGVFVGDKQISKTPIFLDRKYVFALVSNDGKAQLYVNGYPDAAPLSHAIADDADAKVVDGKVTAKALSSEDVLAEFKKHVKAKEVVTVGHRGDNHGSPENTVISYENAIANKTPIVEMDLRLTKDNVLVLLHDVTVDRTTGTKGKKAILDMTLEEAQKLDAGSWKDAKYKGEKIPTVEAVLKACRGKSIAMFDLKCTGLGQSIAELKQKMNFPSEGLILAPWEEADGIELRKVLPDVPMVLLHGKLDDYTGDYFNRLKKIGYSGFSINWQIITQDFIDAAHKNGMKVYLWTVNEPCEVAGGVLAGVDGIITDDTPGTMKIVNELTGK